MKRSLLVSLVVSILLTGFFLSPGITQNQGQLLPNLPDPVPVEDVVIRGLEIWEGADIRSLIIQKGLRPGQTYEPSSLQELVRTGLQRLHQEGLFSDIQVRYEDRMVLYEVVEYPRVSSVEFEGLESINQDQLESQLLISKGDPASERSVGDAARQIEQFYAMQGYGSVDVKTQLKPVGDSAVNVIFTIREGEQKIISELEFHYVDELGIIQKARTNWNLRWRLPVNVGSPYSPQILRQTVATIQNWYQERGHMEVQVTPRTMPDPDDAGMKVVMEIREGPVYYLGNITITGNKAISDRELRRQVPLEKGDLFNRALMERGLQEMEYHYEDQGYADATIFQPDHYDFELDRQDNRVHVRVQVLEGEPIIVERIDIRGNRRTYTGVIRREIQLEPGELLDGSKRRQSLRRLRRLGFFQKVQLNIDPGSAPNRRIVRVTVKEGPTGQLQFGGGYSSSIGFIGNFSVRKDNFSLWDPRDAFTGRGQSLQAQVQFGDERENFNVSWDDPWFNDDLDNPREPTPEVPISFGWSAFNQEFDRRTQDYSESRQGGSIRTGREFGPGLVNKIDIEYSFQSNSAFNVGSDAPRRIRREAQTRKPTDEFQREIGSLEPGIQRDVRDNRRFPTEGYYLRLSSAWANSSMLGGNSDFYRPRFEGRHYYPLSGGMFTAIRLNFQTLDTWKQDVDEAIPVFEEFFLGGFRDIRGYNFRDLAIYEGEGSNAQIVSGGRTATYTNLELRYRMIEDGTMQLFSFYDIGNVFEHSWQIDSSNLKRSSGFGMRIFTPVGPISISWAQQLDETFPGANDAGESQIDFNIGGAF